LSMISSGYLLQDTKVKVNAIASKASAFVPQILFFIMNYFVFLNKFQTLLV
jgi:hypothetical protein